MLKKLFPLLFVFSFLFLMGCEGKITVTPTDDGVVVEKEITMEEPEVKKPKLPTVTEEEPVAEAPAESETVAKCIFSSSCKGEKDLCFEGECTTLEAVFEKYRNCGPDSDSKFYCPGECEGCKDGKLSCLNASSGDVSFHFCSDCATDYSCAEGYKCDSDHHKCILKE